MNSEEQIIRDSILDVLGSHRFHLYEGSTDPQYQAAAGVVVITEIYAYQQQLQFCDQVIARVRELMHTDIPEDEAPQDEEIHRLAAMEVGRMRELALDKALAGLMAKGLITRVPGD